jgi:hypothetical protein
MSVERTLICDGCGAVIDAGRTAAIVRAEAKRNGAKVNLPGGKDLCPDCVRRGRSAE